MKRTSTAKLSKLFILCTITFFSLNTASRKSMAEEIKITDIENIGEALSEAEDNASKQTHIQYRYKQVIMSLMKKLIYQVIQLLILNLAQKSHVMAYQITMQYA